MSSLASAEPVKITNIGHGYYSGALYVAKQEKLFEKHGLEPDISYVQGGALALQAALTKQADVGILSYEHILTVGGAGQAHRRLLQYRQSAGEQRDRQRQADGGRREARRSRTRSSA